MTYIILMGNVGYITGVILL